MNDERVSLELRREAQHAARHAHDARLIVRIYKTTAHPLAIPGIERLLHGVPGEVGHFMDGNVRRTEHELFRSTVDALLANETCSPEQLERWERAQRDYAQGLASDLMRVLTDSGHRLHTVPDPLPQTEKEWLSALSGDALAIAKRALLQWDGMACSRSPQEEYCRLDRIAHPERSYSPGLPPIAKIEVVRELPAAAEREELRMSEREMRLAEVIARSIAGAIALEKGAKK